MKIIVIGFLYNLLLQSNAAGEPAVKVQLCSDFFKNGNTESLKKINLPKLKEEFEDFEIKESRGKAYGAHGKNRRPSNVKLALSNIQLEDYERSQILSNSNFEIGIKARLEYGENSFVQNGRRRSQNPYLYLNMEIIGKVSFRVNREKIVYGLQECEGYLRSYESNIPDIDLDTGRVRGAMLSKLCRVVRQIIDILNENGKDNLIIDPSGHAKLDLESTSLKRPNCLELNFNLVVDDSEVISEQSHDVLSGNGVSLGKGYINNRISYDAYLQKLNEKLADKKLELSPKELQMLIHDISEKDPTILKITVTKMQQLFLGDENDNTIVIELEGFFPKEDKAVFDVIFGTKLKIDFLLSNKKLILRFLSSGDINLLQTNSNIGKSGELDIAYLQKVIQQIIDETLLPALNDLQISVNIPFCSLVSSVVSKLDSVQLLL